MDTSADASPTVVGPEGVVYPTDVQEQMICELNKRVIDRGYENVAVVHGGFDDPTLPSNCCDLVFEPRALDQLVKGQSQTTPVAPK